MWFRRVWGFAALATCGMAVGCVDVVPFACADDSQCDRVEGARCFEDGCASPDPACAGGYRYADDALLSRRGECVDAAGTSSTTSETPGSTADATTSTGDPSSSSGSSSTTGSSTTGSSSSSSSGTTSGGSSSTTGCQPDDCTCAQDLQVGNQYNCVLRDDAAIACWGQNSRGQAGTADPELSTLNQPTLVDLAGNDAAEVAAHFEHSCARLLDGSVWCWGRNLYGMVDPVAPMDVNLDPRVVDGVEAATGLRMGLRSSCARHADDTLTCWGWELYDLLLTDSEGNGPFTTGPYDGLVDLQIGLYHGCMWTADEVSCWGRNNWGQVGQPAGGEFSQPQSVALPGSPSWVGVGRNHACAVVDDEVWCWGYNQTNQIAADETPAGFPTPTRVDGPWNGSITRLFAQGFSTCVETDIAELWCWGGTQAGWLGVDGVANNAPLWPPQRIASFDELATSPVQLRAGINHFCALMDTAEIYCWGNGTLWQIGPSAPKSGEDTIRVDPCNAE